MFIFNTANVSPYSVRFYEKYDTKKYDDFIFTHLTFDNKESYIEWVKQWKEAYKQLSVQIRKWKQTRNVVLREQDKIFARAMILIRKEGKKKSWELKKQGLTIETK